MCPQSTCETWHVVLLQPTLEHFPLYREYIAALGSQERYPFVLDWEFEPFESWIGRVEQLSGPNYSALAPVPSNTFFMVNEDKILGVTNIRHFLNDDLTLCGGHIGLSIHPETRNQGVGRRLLELSLEQFKQISDQHCHVHCHSANLPSRKLIECCGGKLHSVVNIEGEAISRYIFAL